jgi:NADH dehydrogenase/NADH:ubiquinone oxidoreductase subunit G
MIDNDLFEPYEKLVEIDLRGRLVKVPENNMLLRCFQYLSLDTVSLGDFCWNGDCANCQVWLDVGSPDGKEKPALACRTKVEEGMKIVRIADAIDIND